MQVDVLIIGQGICGTFLSWWLEKAGFSVLVIDDPLESGASLVAAGVINPVTGRRIVKTWMIDELLPFLTETYGQMGSELNERFIVQKNMIDFFPTPQMQLAYRGRQEEDPGFLHPISDEKNWRSFFSYDFGFGEIDPCYLVDLEGLLFSWRNKLKERGQLLEERFAPEQLRIGENQIQYKDFRGGHIVFCDGIGSCDNPFFSKLPFAPNKGEALIVEIRDLPSTNLFKKGINIVPLGDGLFWVGSSYEWTFRDDQPSAYFRQKTESLLKGWLKMPFTVSKHLAAVRPATLERRPFVGFHPTKPQIGILNGMGTKGCSLAPFFARQLADKLMNRAEILPEADIRRFSGILTRTSFQE
jgi:glycine/D-amino acid oxidase-like deaminating enzyme